MQTTTKEQSKKAGATKRAYLPIDLSKASQVFGGAAMEILPPYSAIPDEFKRGHGKWVDWQSKWFFEGLKHYPVPNEGIDLKKAMANLVCVQRSFEPKHEHKAAGVAYLASLWFTSPDGEPVKAGA